MKIKPINLFFYGLIALIIIAVVLVFGYLIKNRSQQQDIPKLPSKEINLVGFENGSPEIENPANSKTTEGEVISNDGKVFIVKVEDSELKFSTPFRVKTTSAQGVSNPPTELYKVQPGSQVIIKYNPDNMLLVAVEVIK